MINGNTNGIKDYILKMSVLNKNYLYRYIYNILKKNARRFNKFF